MPIKLNPLISLLLTAALRARMSLSQTLCFFDGGCNVPVPKVSGNDYPRHAIVQGHCFLFNYFFVFPVTGNNRKWGELAPPLHFRSDFGPQIRISGRGFQSGAAFHSLFQGNPCHALVTVSRSNSVCVALLFGRERVQLWISPPPLSSRGLARRGSGSGSSWQQRLRSQNVGQAASESCSEEENRCPGHMTWPPQRCRYPSRQDANLPTGHDANRPLTPAVGLTRSSSLA